MIPFNPSSIFVTSSNTPADLDIGAAELERIHRLEGYSKIACHFVVRRDGLLDRGRPETEPGALSDTFTRSIQVILVGNPVDGFTEEQMDELRALVRDLDLPLYYDESLNSSPITELA